MENLNKILSISEELRFINSNNDLSGISINIPIEILQNLIEEISELKTLIIKSNNQNQEDKLLTTEEVAKLLNCSNQTVHNYRSRGEILPCKLGRKNLYKKSDIENLLNDSKKSRSNYYEP